MAWSDRSGNQKMQPSTDKWEITESRLVADTKTQTLSRKDLNGWFTIETQSWNRSC